MDTNIVHRLDVGVGCAGGLAVALRRSISSVAVGDVLVATSEVSSGNESVTFA